MPEQIPRHIESITTIDFQDEDHHYQESWRGNMSLREGDVIHLRGDLGISECRPGKYKVERGIPDVQLSRNPIGPDIFYRFYKCTRDED